MQHNHSHQSAQQYSCKVADINKTLLHLAKDDMGLMDSLPSFIGTEFAKRLGQCNDIYHHHFSGREWQFLSPPPPPPPPPHCCLPPFQTNIYTCMNMQQLQTAMSLSDENRKYLLCNLLPNHYQFCGSNMTLMLTTAA